MPKTPPCMCGHTLHFHPEFKKCTAQLCGHGLVQHDCGIWGTCICEGYVPRCAHDSEPYARFFCIVFNQVSGEVESENYTRFCPNRAKHELGSIYCMPHSVFHGIENDKGEEVASFLRMTIRGHALGMFFMPPNPVTGEHYQPPWWFKMMN